MHTHNDNVVKTTTHTHAPDARDSPVKSALANMRRRAKDTHETPRSIVNRVCGIANGPAVSMALPKVSNLSRTIRRTRRRQRNAPAAPRTLENLIIDGDYTLTQKKDNFILFDSGQAVHRMIVFWYQCQHGLFGEL